ncbi:MAG: type II secretion system protein GspN [Pseudomonadota bacterium]
MPKLFKYIGYLIIFVVTFIIFLYWLFPYNVLKERVAAAIEEPFGGAVEVSIGEIEPYYFTGVDISNLAIASRTEQELLQMIKLDRVRGRAKLFSLLFGKPDFSFYIKAGKGEISGSVDQLEDGFDLEVDFDEFDVSHIKWLPANLGLQLSGQIDGGVDLRVDRLRPARTEGSIDISFINLKLADSILKIAGGGFEMPSLVLTEKRGSRLKLQISKGTALIDMFKFEGGDLELDMKGKAFLGNSLDNLRLNISGSFKVSEKLAKELPFLFIVQKQKQQDGSYPLSVSGRINSPAIKIGTFTVPL